MAVAYAMVFAWQPMCMAKEVHGEHAPPELFIAGPMGEAGLTTSARHCAAGWLGLAVRLHDQVSGQPHGQGRLELARS